MAADKQIFELPEITLDILQAAGEVSFVAQVSGYDLDFQVPLDVMAAYLGQNTGSTKYTGSTNPDNAIGNNGDLYVQTNGKTYIKSSGSWVLVTAPALLPYKQTLTAFNGESNYSPPAGYSIYRVNAYLPIPGDFEQPHPEFITGVSEFANQIRVNNQGQDIYLKWT